MTKSNSIHIGINRKRLKLVGIGYAIAALFIFCGFYYISTRFEGNWSNAMKIIGGIIAVFSGVTGLSAVKPLNDKNAGITIDENGILDQSTSISSGLISWKSISNLESNSKEKMILIKVKKPDDFTKNAKNRAIKQLLQRNLAIYKTPVVIESNYLNCSFDELQTTLETQFKKFAHKKL